jgi:hypothetical protein
MTIVDCAHTYLVVSLVLIGYKEYYQTLFELLHLDYNNSIMQTHHKRLCKKKIKKRAYDKLPAVQRRAATTHAIRIWEIIRKLPWKRIRWWRQVLVLIRYQ